MNYITTNTQGDLHKEYKMTITFSYAQFSSNTKITTSLDKGTPQLPHVNAASYAQ